MLVQSFRVYQSFSYTLKLKSLILVYLTIKLTLHKKYEIFITGEFTQCIGPDTYETHTYRPVHIRLFGQ